MKKKEKLQKQILKLLIDLQENLDPILLTGNQSFIKVEENSSQDKRDFKQVNLYEEANFNLTKNLKEWLQDTLNLKFSQVC